MVADPSAEFARYAEATSAHHELQKKRVALSDGSGSNPEQIAELRDVDAALDVSGDELDAARNAYLSKDAAETE